MLAYINDLDTPHEIVEIHTSSKDGECADKIILHVMLQTLLQYRKKCDAWPDDFVDLENWMEVVNQIVGDLELYLSDNSVDEETEAFNRENLRGSLKLYAEYFDDFWVEK